MIRTALFCLILLVATNEVVGQDKIDLLRNQCETILIDEYKRLSSVGEERQTISAMMLLAQIPGDQSKQLLLKRIGDASINIATTAASLLAKRHLSDDERRKVFSAFDQLKPSTTAEKVSVLRARAMLDDKTAVAELVQWAALDMAKLPIGNSHACPMLCLKPSDKPGRCPVCGMEMQELRNRLTAEEYEAQTTALFTLRELKHKNVSALAKGVLLSDAPAWNRLQAAYAWCLEEPVSATPHLNLFLSSENLGGVAFGYLAEASPLAMSEQFEKLISDNDLKNLLGRYDAFRGLIKIGKPNTFSVSGFRLTIRPASMAQISANFMT